MGIAENTNRYRLGPFRNVDKLRANDSSSQSRYRSCVIFNFLSQASQFLISSRTIPQVGSEKSPDRLVRIKTREFACGHRCQRIRTGSTLTIAIGGSRARVVHSEYST